MVILLQAKATLILSHNNRKESSNRYITVKLSCRAEGSGHDTVGAVALDVHGNVAFATSTGGITAKQPGRVGDSPIIGIGYQIKKIMDISMKCVLMLRLILGRCILKLGNMTEECDLELQVQEKRHLELWL